MNSQANNFPIKDLGTVCSAQMVAAGAVAFYTYLLLPFQVTDGSSVR